MRKPKELSYQLQRVSPFNNDFVMSHENFNILLESHNNLLEVVNYLWKYVQDIEDELISLPEED